MENLELTKELLRSIDAMNTLHGGVSETQVRLSQKGVQREIRLRVPGVDVAKYRAEIHNNQLTVFYLVPMQSLGKERWVPVVVYQKNIPYFINTKGIRAQVENDELVVTLPFNEFASGYHKDLIGSWD